MPVRSDRPMPTDGSGDAADPIPCPIGVGLPIDPALDRAIARHKTTVKALAAAAIDRAPDDPAPVAIQGLLAITAGRRDATLSAAQALKTARRLVDAHGSTDPCRAALIAALAAGVCGERRLAARHLDTVLARDPDQVGLLKIAHTLKFMAGDLPGMADSLDRVLTGIRPDHPEYGPVLGMKAFVQEEAGDLDAAERTGREAVARAPDDAWGVHAVGHVMEARGTPKAGLAWFADNAVAARDANNFRFHMAWHCALYHLTLNDTEAVLDLYDRAVRPSPTDDFRDIANAASLLWRLKLEGVAAGDRWEELADLAESHIGEGELTFADLHYLMALLGAGRDEPAEALTLQLIDRSRAARSDAGHEPEQARALARGGAAAAEGLMAFARGDADAAWAAWQRVADLSPVGGSLAQRDVFDRSAVDAALAAGDDAAATRRLNTRLDRQPGDVWAKDRRRRLTGLASPTGRSASVDLRTSRPPT